MKTRQSKLDYFNHNSYNNQKGVTMQSVTASQIKQNSTILQNAFRGDLLVTKRDKPFVVVMDYKRYTELTKQTKKTTQKDWIEESFGVISEKESQKLLSEIDKLKSKYRKKDIVSLFQNSPLVGSIELERDKGEYSSRIEF